jgi:hypothetical protein
MNDNLDRLSLDQKLQVLFKAALTSWAAFMATWFAVGILNGGIVVLSFLLGPVAILSFTLFVVIALLVGPIAWFVLDFFDWREIDQAICLGAVAAAATMLLARTMMWFTDADCSAGESFILRSLLLFGDWCFRGWGKEAVMVLAAACFGAIAGFAAFSRVQKMLQPDE